MQEKYERLTDSEWKVMAEFLPVQRKRKMNLRDVVDMGYTGPFHQACMDHLGAPAEVSSKPPSEKGFVPVKWRWVSERTFGCFNFYRSLSKDYERTVENSEAWIMWANCQMNILKITANTT